MEPDVCVGTGVGTCGVTVRRGREGGREGGGESARARASEQAREYSILMASPLTLATITLARGGDECGMWCGNIVEECSLSCR